jgi:hypothetical protein
MIAPTTEPIRIADTWLGLLGASLVACAFAFAVFGIPPLPPAPMLLLGVPSPLTGMTRSFVALAHGDVARSFAMHPLGPLCFGACVVAAISFALSLRTHERPKIVDRIVRLPYSGWIAAAAFMIVWVRQIAVFG